VALVAVRVLQLVVPIHMTLLTLHRHVSTREGEVRRTVIERRIGPVCRRVTLHAIMIEVARDMIRA
jgi:hypothetical protein